MTYRPRRSVLYMPAVNARALDKARTLPADALIFDLEDSVAPEAKAEARLTLAKALGAGGYGHRERVVRVNALATPWGQADMQAAVAMKPDAILVPKVSTAAEVQNYATLAGGIALWAMIETPLAILNAARLAEAAAPAGLSCFVLGTNDLVKDTRISAANQRAALVPALVTAVLAARAFGLDCIDGVYNDFRDEAGFASECEQGLALGMDGKTLIHPGQIEICNRVFSPSATEIAWAEKVIAVFAAAENVGRGVLTLEGKMVERLHLVMAERVVAVAKAATP